MWHVAVTDMNCQLDEEFEPRTFEYDDMWKDVSIALDEIDLQTLDRVLAREKFDAMVAARRTVHFRIDSNPGGGMAGFKSIFTYVFPCKHLSCECSCPE